MNFADELLLTYRGRPADARAFLLSQLLDLPAGPSSDALVELLWQEVRAQDVAVKRQARYVLGQYLPRHTARAYGLSGHVPGIWSAYLVLAGESVEEPAPGRGIDEGEARARLDCGRAALAPLTERLARLTAAGPAGVRAAASLALAPLAAEKTVDELVGQIAGAKLSTTAAFVIGEIGGGRARAALLEAIRKHGKAAPWLFFLLRGCPGPEPLRYFEKLVDRTDVEGRVAIAEALATFPLDKTRGLLGRLLASGETAVVVQALDAAAGRRDREVLEPVADVLARATDDALRVQALRALGATGAARAAELAAARLDDPSAAVQAAALEALVQCGLKASELAPLVRPLLERPSPAVRARAVLALAPEDPEWGASTLEALVLDRDPRARIEGVHVLGYLQGEGASQLLERIALVDDEPAVSVHAVRGLARLDLTDGLPSLLRLLTSPSVPVLAETCRALVDLPTGSARLALDVMEGAIAGSRSVEERAALMLGLGVVAGAAGRGAPGALVEGVRAPDERVARAALDGACRLGDALPVSDVRPLLNHTAPATRARAALALLLAGERYATDAFATMLDASDEETVRSACRALLELGNVLPAAVASPRHGRLVEWFKRDADSAAIAAHAAAARAGARTTKPTNVGATPADVAPNASVPPVPDGGGFPLPARQRAEPLERVVRTAPHVVRSRGADGLLARYAPSAATAPWVAALRASLEWPRCLMYSPLLVIALVLAGGGSTSPAEALPPVVAPSAPAGQLAVVEVEGTVTLTSAGGDTSKLRPQAKMAVGDRVETAAGGRAVLADALGNSVRVESASSVALTEATSKPVRFHFKDPKGRLHLDLRMAGESELRADAFGVQLSRAVLDVEREGEGARLTLRAGGATAFTAGGALHRLAAGKQLPLDAPQKSVLPAPKRPR
jgi:HEAT repeat protein